MLPTQLGKLPTHITVSRKQIAAPSITTSHDALLPQASQRIAQFAKGLWNTNRTSD